MADRPTTEDDTAVLDRRALLAAVGVSALSGCSTLDRLAGDDVETIQSFDLRQIDPGENPEPPVPESIPVEIAPEHLQRSRDRVTTLLSEIPIPLGPSEIPNGYVREQLADAAADATTRLDDARTAETAFVALEALHRARERARFAAAGWAVADDGLGGQTLRERHRAAVTDARAIRGDYEYVGENLVRAVAVHSRIETRLAWAATSEIRADRARNHLLELAEWGQTTEAARTHLADARHLSEQFTRSLSGDAGTVEDTLTEAAEQLFETVRSRAEDRPPEPTAENWGVSERVIDDLRRRTSPDVNSVQRAAGPASAVVDALGRLTRTRALDWATQRIDAGEIGPVESAQQVKSVRQDALDAISDARTESPARPLARRVLHDAGRRVLAGDRRIAELRGEVSARQLRDAIADYVVGTALARNVPESCRTVVAALESG
jgi:hypothetical protein